MEILAIRVRGQEQVRGGSLFNHLRAPQEDPGLAPRATKGTSHTAM